MDKIFSICCLSFFLFGCPTLVPQKNFEIPGVTAHSATLLEATGHISAKIKTALDSSPAWIPLPLNYATQVPLVFKISTTPLRIAKKITFKSDELGNWGASIELRQDLKEGTSVLLDWDVVVFTKGLHDDAERASLYQHPGENAEWLKSTAIVQSDIPEIKTITSQVTSENSTPLENMREILNWTSQNIKYKAHGLDAASALKFRESTCTGRANLAAALGRSAGIPSVTLAGYLVGLPQETHWVNEFYLGAGLGWRRVEPSRKKAYIDEDAFISVRIDRSTDEVIWKYTKGIPLNSYPVLPIGIPIPVVTPSVLQKVSAEPKTLDDLFLRLKKEWTADFDHLLKSGRLSESRAQIRKKFKSVSSVKELESILINLEATK